MNKSKVLGYMKKKYSCNVERALDLLSGKWGTLILRELLKGPKRHKELIHGIEGINSRTLTTKLRHLEENGIIRRTVFPEVPPRVVYAITEYGEESRAVIESLRTWGSLPRPTIHLT